MNREMEKIMKQISKQLNKKTYENKDELQKELDKINYNINNYEEDETDSSRSDDILEEAYNANSLKQARELAKKALIIYPDNIDAMTFLASLESNETKGLQKINNAILKAEEMLKRDNYFNNVGHFWGIIETRPYLRAIAERIRIYISLKQYENALNDCKEIIRLNSNDNMGIRYTLMNLYCHLDKYEELYELCEKYKEEDAYELFPLTISYYKQNNMDKVKEYLDRLNKCNKYLIGFLTKKIAIPKGHPEYYSSGSVEEAVLIIEDAFYLINDNIDFINYLKKEV